MSHYCEKARWGLQRAGLIFEEVRCLQGLHSFAVKQVGAGPTVPVLVLDDDSASHRGRARVLGESHDILEYCHERVPQARLYPVDEPQRQRVRDLEREFDEGLGVASRHIFYACVPSFSKEILFHYNNQGVPRWQDLSMRWFFPLALAYMRKKIDFREEKVAKSHLRVQDAFDRIEARLSDGRRYLEGDRFSAADLTFAALSAPVLGPDEYGIALPTMSEIPSDYRKIIETFREHPAGQFALRLYVEHRKEVLG